MTHLSHLVMSCRARFAWSHTLHCLLATTIRDNPRLALQTACRDGSDCVSCLFRSSIFGQSGQREDSGKEDSSLWLSSTVPRELFLLRWQAVNSRIKPKWNDDAMPFHEYNVLNIKRTEELMVPDHQRSFPLLSASVPCIMSVLEPNRREIVRYVWAIGLIFFALGFPHTFEFLCARLHPKQFYTSTWHFDWLDID